MESQIENIKEKTARFNAAADDATAKLMEVEKQLVKAGVGISVLGESAIGTEEVLVYRPENGGAGAKKELYFVFLGFRKNGHKWQITIFKFHATSKDEDEALIQEIPIEHASRADRICAASHIDDLLKAIDVELDKRLKSLP